MEFKSSHNRRTPVASNLPFIAENPSFPSTTPEFYLPPEQEDVLFDPKIHLALPFQVPQQ
jgi:hypothetical protein